MNECSDDSCGNGTCVNMVNHGFSCSCFEGFETYQKFDQGVEECVDIDECFLQIDSCGGDHASCKNLVGTYECICDPGFGRVSGECEDIDECASELDNCTDLTCVNTMGSFKCCKFSTLGTDWFFFENITLFYRF